MPLWAVCEWQWPDYYDILYGLDSRVHNILLSYRTIPPGHLSLECYNAPHTIVTVSGFHPLSFFPLLFISFSFPYYCFHPKKEKKEKNHTPAVLRLLEDRGEFVHLHPVLTFTTPPASSKQLPSKTSTLVAKMIITRLVSLTNFVVASSALGFQVFVLYPWHKQLDESFEELKKEHVRVLQAVRDVANEVDPGSRRGIRDGILQRMGVSNATKA